MEVQCACAAPFQVFVRKKQKIPAANGKLAAGNLFFSQKIIPSPAEFQKAAEIVGIRVGKSPENGWTTL